VSSVAIIAVGAVSPLGLGEAAFSVGKPGETPATRVVRDAGLVRAGLSRPLAARAALDPSASDRASALLSAAAELLVVDLDRALPGWRARRLLLCIGTSAGGMPSLESVLDARSRSREIGKDAARAAFYDGPLRALRRFFDAPALQVLAACASSTVAVGLGCRWLEGDAAELVIAGGYDALTDFVATGFEALGATTAARLEPFRETRDGMALGEGAALVALCRAGDALSVRGFVEGFSLSNDAVHVTAPDPEGRGLASAALGALTDASLEPRAIALVSAHATSTVHNDAAEARALGRVFGATTSAPVVHPFKAVTGHCLGASGVLEVLAALDAMGRGIAPAALGEGRVLADFPGRLLAQNQEGVAGVCLKLSSGFGGSNAALVLRPSRHSTRAARVARPVSVVAVGERVAETSLEAIGRHAVVDEARVARISAAGGLAATAVASALDAWGGFEESPRSRTGVVVGTYAACLEENERFDRVRRERGARAAEPRRFSRTSPNLPAGECAIVYGFSGPGFAMGGGPRAALEALLVGSDLVAFGDAEHVVVVTCDEVGDVVRLLASRAELPVPEHGALAVVIAAAQQGSQPLDRAALVELLGCRELDSGSSLLAAALSKATGT
jgi:3-oxoacyl-[acyl-carrier-protein] synthase II